MRLMILTTALCAMALSASAQTPPKHHHHTGIKPIDKGPNTPAANGAYQGGGMVLQGAPGAPAPRPEATPPGQTPRGMVPQ